MTQWITPKTNWRYGDYYQDEDAERFVNNLTYLKELAEPSYPDEINFFALRESYGGNYYHSQWNISFNTMYIYNNTSDLTYMFAQNIQTLFKLSILVQHGWTTLGNKYPLQHTEHENGSWTVININSQHVSSSSELIRYKGWFTSDSIAHTIYTDPLEYEWRNSALRYITRPFTAYRYSSSNISKVAISNSNTLGNTRFFSEDNLNTIENRMANLYTFFNEVAESFPDEDGWDGGLS